MRILSEPGLLQTVRHQSPIRGVLHWYLLLVGCYKLLLVSYYYWVSAKWAQLNPHLSWTSMQSMHPQIFHFLSFFPLFPFTCFLLLLLCLFHSLLSLASPEATLSKWPIVRLIWAILHYRLAPGSVTTRVPVRWSNFGAQHAVCEIRYSLAVRIDVQAAGSGS